MPGSPELYIRRLLIEAILPLERGELWTADPHKEGW